MGEEGNAAREALTASIIASGKCYRCLAENASRRFESTAAAEFKVLSKKQFDAAIAIKPDSSEALIERGKLSFIMRDGDLGEEDFQEASAFGGEESSEALLYLARLAELGGSRVTTVD